MTPEFKMAKAKSRLILEQPFYASLVCNMPWDRDDSVGTMCTNGDWVKWSGPFVESLTLDEVLFVLCHEVMHVVFEHVLRRNSRDPLVWNQATDYVINDYLIQENVGTIPKGGLHNQQLVQAGNHLAERVYDLLPQPPPDKGNGNGSGKSGGGFGAPGSMASNGHGNPLDQCQDHGSGSEAEKNAKSADIRVKVAQAAQAAKMCGKLSANMARLVGEVLQPKVDWRTVLRRFVASRAKIDASFAKPKRRFIADDIYLPSLDGESIGKLVVAVDCSGSIGGKELAEFAAEITAIHEDMRPAGLHVVYFDSEVCHHDKFEQDDPLHIQAHGGGGTAFSPIFRFSDEQDIDPVGCVVLTDLCCSDFGPPPNYPVLWVTTHSEQAPWGEVIKM